jgi:DNA-binding XRE family transcriptional regulator
MMPSILLALKLADALEVPVGQLFWLRGSGALEPAP